LQEKFGESRLREFLANENLYAGNAASLTESEARTILRAGSLDAARDRIFAAGQESLSAARLGVFSEARPASRAQVLDLSKRPMIDFKSLKDESAIQHQGSGASTEFSPP
jgi:hypothetical protein